MTASLRSGMLTTTRRVAEMAASRAESAASDGCASISAMTIVLIVEGPLMSLVFISFSLLGTRVATAEPTPKPVLNKTLLDVRAEIPCHTAHSVWDLTLRGDVR